MMHLPLITLIFLFPLLTFAQSGTVTGKVVNAENQSALPKASVFLNGTTYGTATNDEGIFTLKNVTPGKYLLIASMVGFEKFSQEVLVSANSININITLIPHVTPLDEVSIELPKDWERNYKMFIKGFIGTSYYGRRCKILNSDVLNFSYDKKKGELSAWSDDLVKIENRALGYIVNIRLTKSKFYNYGSVKYWNELFFAELPGTPEEVKKWKAERLKLLQDRERQDLKIGTKMPGIW